MSCMSVFIRSARQGGALSKPPVEALQKKTAVWKAPLLGTAGSLSSVTERDHWVGFRCSDCRDVTRQERDSDQGKGYSGKGQRIERAHVEKHGAQSTAAHDSEDQSQAGADQDKLRGPADY